MVMQGEARVGSQYPSDSGAARLFEKVINKKVQIGSTADAKGRQANRTSGDSIVQVPPEAPTRSSWFIDSRIRGSDDSDVGRLGSAGSQPGHSPSLKNA